MKHKKINLVILFSQVSVHTINLLVLNIVLLLFLLKPVLTHTKKKHSTCKFIFTGKPFPFFTCQDVVKA